MVSNVAETFFFFFHFYQLKIHDADIRRFVADSIDRDFIDKRKMNLVANKTIIKKYKVEARSSICELYETIVQKRHLNVIFFFKLLIIF